LWRGPALVIEIAAGRDRLTAGRVKPLESDIHQRLAIQRKIYRLANALVLHLLRARAIADIELHIAVADIGSLRELERAVALDAFHIGRRKPLDDLELARLQVREPDGGIVDGEHLDSVDVDVLGVPIFRE